MNIRFHRINSIATGVPIPTGAKAARLAANRTERKVIE
jgi:hypothetical protein